MKKTSIEVKTIYDIEITKFEMWELFRKFAESDKDSSIRVIFPKAYENFDFKNDTKGYFDDMINGWGFYNAGGDTYSYIAKHFGFDGWRNAGYFDKNKQVYRMTVYNNGCDL